MEKDLEIIRNVEVEKHFGVSLNEISYQFGDEHIEVFYELTSINGKTIPENVKINIAVLNSNNKILGSDCSLVLADEFFIESLESVFIGIKNVDEVSKLKLYVSAF